MTKRKNPTPTRPTTAQLAAAIEATGRAAEPTTIKAATHGHWCFLFDADRIGWWVIDATYEEALAKAKAEAKRRGATEIRLA